MTIYKHIAYNPRMKGIQAVIQEAQDTNNLEGSPEWCFLRSQIVTEFEWVAIFERETPALGALTPKDNINLDCCVIAHK